jgi:HD-GYP domain-containing protein (c-di-GMP phosphodiesterase class II)
MLRKWFGKKVEVAETAPQDDVDVVFNTQSDFDDVSISKVDKLDIDDLDEKLDVSEYDEDLDTKESSEPKVSFTSVEEASLENKVVSPIGPALATIIPLAAYITLLQMPSYDHSHMLMRGHFYIVSVVSLIAAAIAFIVGLAGTKLRNIQITLVSLAFISLGILFGLHGLATPGFILEKNPVVGFSAPLSIIFTLFWFFLSSLGTSHPILTKLSKGFKWLVPVWTGFLLSLSILFMLQPQLASVVPLDQNPLQFIAGFVALELAVMAGWNYWQSYRYTRSPLQLAIVYSAGWLGVSSIIMSTGTLWHTSWWIYHGLLFFAVVVTMGGIIAQYNRGRSLALALVSRSHQNAVERMEAALSPGVKRLIEITEQHDAYTAGHNHRVAVMAVDIGQAMGLSPDQLRALAQGGIIHDLGKINIPSEVLNKPGKLEFDEREMVEKHPVQGYDLAKRLGFMPDELDIIRHHHEKWDGTGYPDKLAGEDIPLLARITAIADVYDALTSERAYRKPWSHEQARTHILGQAGSHFDPECVQAWDQINQEVEEAEDVRELLTATVGATA